MVQNRIKIAFIINYMKRTGPGLVVYNMLSAIDKDIFEPFLVTLFDGSDQEVLDDLSCSGVIIKQCNFNRKTFLKDIRKLRMFLSREFNIVHSHGVIPDYVASRLNRETKSITTVHSSIKEDYSLGYGFLAKPLIFIHKCVLKRIDIVVACSQSATKGIENILNLTYIRNGIDQFATDKIDRKELNIPENSVVFVYVGWLNKRKNVKELVQLFVKNHSRNDYLIIVGSGVELEQCKSVADDHVVFTGYQNNPIKYLNSSDIYVSAALSEGFSISAIEGLSCGLSLLLSDIRSHNEMINMIEEEYIGEVFSKENFGVKFNLVKENRKNKDDIKEYYKKYLTARRMMMEYENKYKELITSKDL